METRASKRKRLLEESLNQSREMNRDRISDLPDPILHHILSFLPIDSIARTSLLSKRWTSLWRSYPCLDFSTFHPRIGSPPAGKRHHDQQAKAAEFITTLLSRRRDNSNVKTFRLKRTPVSFSCLYDCIRRLVKNSVEELELDVYLSDNFDLPRCLFSCDSLRELRLSLEQPNPQPRNPFRSCYFGFPTSHVLSSKSLRSVKTLSLSFVHFTDGYLVADLFSGANFPRLETLFLKECRGMPRLKVDNCPCLESLELEDLQLTGLDVAGERLEELKVTRCFRNPGSGKWVKIFAPNLEAFFWDFNAVTETCSMESFKSLQRGSIYFVFETLSAAKLEGAATVISVLSFAESIFFGRRAVELLSDIYYGGGLLRPFSKLATLDLLTGLNKRDIPGIVCLLRSSPILHTLTITIQNCFKTGFDRWNRDLLDNSNFTEEQYWESQRQAFKSLEDHLKVVKIDVQGTDIHESAVNLVKFLLRHGKVLEEMTLSSEANSADPPPWKEKIGSEIMKFPRASSTVKISLN